MRESNMLRYETFLNQSAARFPDKIALALGDQTLTYAEWLDAANRLASSLLAQGFQRDDRAVVFLDNSLETAISIFAILKAGGVFTIVNASTKADKLAYILDNCRASTLITQQRLLPHANAAIEQAKSVNTRILVGAKTLPDGWISFDGAIESAPSGEPGCSGTSLDLAMIVYTSGSTGRPKGVMMTHENIDAASWSITTYLENVSDDVILCASR